MSKYPDRQTVDISVAPEGSDLPTECSACGSANLVCDANVYMTHGDVISVTLLPNNVFSCTECGQEIEIE
jgi:hypothetical protein